MRTCDDFGILDRQKTIVELFFKTLKRKFWKKVVEHGYNSAVYENASFAKYMKISA